MQQKYSSLSIIVLHACCKSPCVALETHTLPQQPGLHASWRGDAEIVRLYFSTVIHFSLSSPLQELLILDCQYSSFPSNQPRGHKTGEKESRCVGRKQIQH